MNDLNLDREKCRRRNALAGLRGNVECSRIRFLRDEEFRKVAATGSLPKDDEAALALINARIPGPALSADQVWIHYMEAASTRFISDRFMFLHPSTLKNIVKGADAGFAFMNSHRTGDLSTPSELPFGRAFVGQYQTHRDEAGNTTKTAMLGVYMLRGQKPNGGNGPSTDDLHAGIDGGTIFDVSMGLYGGSKVCDVCGNDLYARDEEGSYLCKHVPGTHRKMSKDEINAQKAKGAKDGLATYSLVGADPGEVSAVYDGAIPGAGFRKAVSLAKSHQFSRSDWREAVSAYPTLSPERKDRTVPNISLRGLAALFAQNPHVENDLEEDDMDQDFESRRAPAPPPPPPAPPKDPEHSAELARLRAEVQQLKSDTKAKDDAARKANADRFAETLVASNMAVPAERASLAKLHLQLSSDDADHPLGGESSRVSVLEGLTKLRTKHALTTEQVNANKESLRTLENDPADENSVESLAKKDAEHAARWQKRQSGRND